MYGRARIPLRIVKSDLPTGLSNEYCKWNERVLCKVLSCSLLVQLGISLGDFYFLKYVRNTNLSDFQILTATVLVSTVIVQIYTQVKTIVLR